MPSKKRSRSSSNKTPKDVQLDPAVFGDQDSYGNSGGSAVHQHTAASQSDSRKSERLAEQTEQTSRTQKRLSKSQQRKMKKLAVRCARLLHAIRTYLFLLQEDKVKKARRADLYASLQKSTLSTSHAALIKPSGRMGQSDTLRQRVKRDFQLEKLGLKAEGTELTSALAAAGSADDFEAALQRDYTAAAEVEESDSVTADDAAAAPPSAAISGSGQSGVGTGGFSVQLGGSGFSAFPTPVAATQATAATATQVHDADGDVDGAIARLAELRAKNQALASAGRTAVDSRWVDEVRREAKHSSMQAAEHGTREVGAAGPHYVPGEDAVLSMASRLAQRTLAAAAEELVEAGGKQNKKRNKKGSGKAVFASRRGTVVVPRPEALQTTRLNLPVCGMEQEIMEAIYEHDAVILCGETGSGKTTQVPQFLYEAGFGSPVEGGIPGMIAVTQPRRVAAVAMAERVASELCTKVGGSGHVGYQVRYDASHVSSHTRVKFLTDGILLREMQSDLLLRRYSVIILDEAHERNLNTDVLIGLLSRAVPLRNAMVARGALPPDVPPLKLVIMSATLRVSDFTENKVLFPVEPPVVHVKARQFPVVPHFARRTEMRDYLGEAYKKVTKIHNRLPPGGILVFLTGQGEIMNMVDRLRTHYRFKRTKRVAGTAVTTVDMGPGLEPEGPAAAPATQAPTKQVDTRVAASDAVQSGVAAGLFPSISLTGDTPAAPAPVAALPLVASTGNNPFNFDAEEPADDASVFSLSDDDSEDEAAAGASSDGQGEDEDEESKASDSDSDGSSDDSSVGDDAASTSSSQAGAAAVAQADSDDEEEESSAPIHVLPLYAMLPKAQQAAVFQPPPEGHRLIVVGTNVAETSITIPGIRYVVDCGRVKRRVYDIRNGSSKFQVGWISKASAEQRAGRAGRTGPGHVYRLYSSAVYGDQFEQFDQPEVCVMPLDTMLLQLVSMGIRSLLSFPFPTAPSREGLITALRGLVHIGALESLNPQVPKFLLPLEDLPSGAAELHEGEGDEEGDLLVPGAGGVALQEGMPEGYEDTDADTAEYELSGLGRALADIPVSPALGKMLIVGRQHGLLQHAVACVAAMTVQDPFVRPRVQVSATPPSELGALGEAPKVAAVTGDGEDWEQDDVVVTVDWPSDEEEEVGSDVDSDEDLLNPEAASAKQEEADALRARRAAWVTAQKERQKAAVSEARLAHARWQHPQSDVLTVMRLAGAYAHAATEEVEKQLAVKLSPADEAAAAGEQARYLWLGAPVHRMRDAQGAAFCKEQWVRGKGMLEVFQLRRQLWQVMVREGLVEPPPYPKPVAKLVKAAEHKAQLHFQAPTAHKDAAEGTGGSLDVFEAIEVADAGDALDGEAAASAEGSSDPLVTPTGAPPGTLTTVRPVRSRMYTWLDAYTPRLKVPSPRRELLLRQVVAAGLITRVARRAPADKVGQLLLQAGVTHTLKGGDKVKGSVVPYIPADRTLPKIVFVHPASAVCADTAAAMPGWVVFSDIITSNAAHGRTFMQGVTAIEPAWLPPLAAGTPLVRYGPPLDTPLPTYDSASDSIMASVVPRFGDHSWELPVHRIPHPDHGERLRWFARALLDGSVITHAAFKAVVAHLAAPSSLLTKQAPSKRVLLLLEALQQGPANSGPVTSKAALLRAWAAAPRYLLAEVAMWLPKGKAPALHGLWPKIVASVVGEGDDDKRKTKKARKQ